MFSSVILSICKEEDANIRLIPPSKIIIVIIMQLAMNNIAAVVEVEDKHTPSFFVRAINMYAPSIFHPFL
jgi:hypothetical protein